MATWRERALRQAWRRGWQVRGCTSETLTADQPWSCPGDRRSPGLQTGVSPGHVQALGPALGSGPLHPRPPSSAYSRLGQETGGRKGREVGISVSPAPRSRGLHWLPWPRALSAPIFHSGRGPWFSNVSGLQVLAALLVPKIDTPGGCPSGGSPRERAGQTVGEPRPGRRQHPCHRSPPGST